MSFVDIHLLVRGPIADHLTACRARAFFAAAALMLAVVRMNVFVSAPRRHACDEGAGERTLEGQSASG